MLPPLDGTAVLLDLSLPAGDANPYRRAILENPPLRIGTTAILYTTTLTVSIKGEPVPVVSRSNRYFRDRSYAWEGGRHGGVRAVTEAMELREFPLMRYLPLHDNILHPVGVLREQFLDLKNNGGPVPMHTLYPRCDFDLAMYVSSNEYIASAAQVDASNSRRFELLMYLHDVLDGITHLRQHGVVHRHIKMENILLAKFGAGRRRAVLSDFTEARRRATTRAPSAGGGSPASPSGTTLPFTAPEVISAADDQTCADMWSVGVVCLAILHTSSSSYTGDPVEALAQAIQKTGTSNATALQEAVDAVLSNYFDARPMAAKDPSVLGGAFIRKCLRVDGADRPDPGQVPKSGEAIAAEDLARELQRTDKYKTRQCALDVLPNAMTYRDAALMCLLRGESATGWWALGRSMFEMECYIEAIAADPRHSPAYLSLGELLGSSSATATATLRSGRVLSQRDCYIEAASCDAKNSVAFIRLGKIMSSKEVVTLSDGRTITQRECFLRALMGDPNSAAAFHCLGLSLAADPPKDAAGVAVTARDGKILNEQQCYIEALNCDPKLADAYVCLGLTIAPGDATPVKLRDGRQLSQQQCFIEAVKWDPTNANAWINLGTTFDENTDFVTVTSSTVTSANGSPITRRLTEQQCYIEALAHDPRNASAYFNLATVLRPSEVVSLRDGRQLTERQCYIEALWFDPRNSKAMNNLGYGMTSWETVTLRDARVMSKRDCYTEAINMDSQDANAYVNLGKVMGDGTVTLRDGRVLSQRECFLEALLCDPHNAEAYHQIGVTMGADEVIELKNGTRLTLSSCVAFGKQQSRAASPR
jgi:serine/threonine protein kinase